MKKLILIFSLLISLISCKSAYIEIYNGSEKIYEGEGKITPDFESPTFNIEVKETTGNTILFFGRDLKGFYSY